MSLSEKLTSIKRYYHRLSGSTIEYELTEYENLLLQINNIKNELSSKSDFQLKELSQKLKADAVANSNLEDILVDAYALVNEAIKRTLKLEPFDVQIIGAIVMHQGKLAEMQTGEGKTLTAVFPAYLNALSGKGVHVLTFNDYLARRDAEWMQPVYNFLGLSVGFVQEGMSIAERKNAYDKDVTYITAKEAGFDFLRDSICSDKENIVHRNFNYAIVDEADSIMIDEARIPLVIAGTSEEAIENKYIMARMASQMKENLDFEFDEYARNIHLTERGEKFVEWKLNCGNIYASENIDLLSRVNCALHAEYLLHRDVDYIIRNEKVELVDDFTGRVAYKRRWPDGLQEAIEVKENIAVQSKGKILNSITLQHFLRLYSKLCGMTATAESAEREFKEFYNLDIVVIPQNKPCIRIDYPDVIFQTKEQKTKAIIEEIINISQTKRPVLVGTGSVAESAQLADELQKLGIACEVLNAKRDEYEAGIISMAGKLGAVTISTNMAGRGTDIKLGADDENEKREIKSLGGLYVIGTNKHESKRIDDQLRGRSGRQGDPGSSRFFISMEDDLCLRYKLDNLIPDRIIDRLEDGEIDNSIVRNEINWVQRIVEGQNLEIKKTLYQYTFLIEEQRRVLFQKRSEYLNDEAVLEFYKENAEEKFNLLLQKSGKDKLLSVGRHILLYYYDLYWSNYLAQMADIKESIHFRRLGGQDPVYEYHKHAVEIFENLQIKIEEDPTAIFNKIDSDKNSDFIFDSL
ncbi:MAG: accessory Sec system translocase SecA2, partial [Ignavibacteriales bacterium]